jgi:hypothetical protein
MDETLPAHFTDSDYPSAHGGGKGILRLRPGTARGWHGDAACDSAVSASWLVALGVFPALCRVGAGPGDHKPGCVWPRPRPAREHQCYAL